MAPVIKNRDFAIVCCALVELDLRLIILFQHGCDSEVTSMIMIMNASLNVETINKFDDSII